MEGSAYGIPVRKEPFSVNGTPFPIDDNKGTDDEEEKRKREERN